jgi:DNA topoisomerase VI subunit B
MMMGKAILKRTTFKTSRLLDFCSEKELVAQTGHERKDWLLVGLKELLDNATDACEEARIAPEIGVVVDASGITVFDNGPGIDADIVTNILDFSVKVSSREAYVSPTRGAQGNALKTLLAMPYVLDGEHGCVDIVSRGQRHQITFKMDRIQQKPVIELETVAADVKNGTAVTLHWPNSASSELLDAKSHFLQLASDYTFLNPHLSLDVDWCGDEINVPATDAMWTKWLPSDPTSPHWYGREEIERLAGAYLTDDKANGRERSIREFVAQFRGLSSSAKQKRVLEQTGLSRHNLVKLVNGNDFDHDLLNRLLSVMQRESKAIKPATLGVIGRDHLEARFAAIGCEMKSFDYKRTLDTENGLPIVIEVAFGWLGDASSAQRRMITGINWSPGIVNPFRSLGTAYGDGLAALLEKQYAGSGEPIVFLLHVACPRVQYSDRGKSAIVLA